MKISWAVCCSNENGQRIFCHNKTFNFYKHPQFPFGSEAEAKQHCSHMSAHFEGTYYILAKTEGIDN